MKKSFLGVLFVCLLLSACQLTPATATPTPAPASVSQTYPLKTGAYWTYEGTVSYEASGTITTDSIRWVVEVIEKVERFNVTGYKMRGSLYDLAFYSPGTTQSEYAIMQVGGRFYTTDLTTYARLNDSSDLLLDLVNEYSLFLQLPLAEGGRFCETGQLTRDDGMYCWVVDAPTTSSYGQAFPLTYRTNGDVSQFSFVPGVGFTAFYYHHNGSVSDADVQLVETNVGATP